MAVEDYSQALKHSVTCQKLMTNTEWGLKLTDDNVFDNSRLHICYYSEKLALILNSCHFSLEVWH